jgi:membrane protease YdiL (CAAX protease family)
MKYIHVTIFIVIYIGLGFILKLDPNQYLLLGIPLSVLFQIFIRKKGIHNAWVRTDEKFKINKNALFYSVILCIYPLYSTFKVLKTKEPDIIILLYHLCMLIGSFACGYAISKMTKKTIKDTILCLFTAGVLGCLMFFASAELISIKNLSEINFNLKSFAFSLLTYVPVVFIIEEVIFRGILDEHISENNTKMNYWSIIYISFLWGWWHLPLTKGGTESILMASLFYPITHTISGFFMSFYWRKSGNLVAPAFSHAFIDAIRNALLK